LSFRRQNFVILSTERFHEHLEFVVTKIYIPGQNWVVFTEIYILGSADSGNP